MPEVTVFTDSQGCSNGTAEINPFTVGDSTNDWTFKFKNDSGFYAPSNVDVRVGHINGLPDGTYNDAFEWIDRADNKSTASIVVTSGVPSVTFDTNPLGGVIGNNGVYILRGPELDGRLLSATILDQGLYLLKKSNDIDYVLITSSSGTPAILKINTTGSVTVQTYTTSSTQYNQWVQGFVSSVSIEEVGRDITQTGLIFGGTSSKFLEVVTTVTGNTTNYTTIFEDGHEAVIQLKSATEKYEFPFKRNESGNNIIAATTLTPYSDGEIDGTAQYDHSALVVRPRDVATASLTQSGTDWVGSLNPINNYVLERLALRQSTQLDIQIFGDNKMLFQGQLSILDKIV